MDLGCLSWPPTGRVDTATALTVCSQSQTRVSCTLVVFTSFGTSACTFRRSSEKQRPSVRKATCYKHFQRGSSEQEADVSISSRPPKVGSPALGLRQDTPPSRRHPATLLVLQHGIAGAAPEESLLGHSKLLFSTTSYPLPPSATN